MAKSKKKKKMSKGLSTFLKIFFVLACITLAVADMLPKAAESINNVETEVDFSVTKTDDNKWNIAWTEFSDSGRYTVKIIGNGSVVYNSGTINGSIITLDTELAPGEYGFKVSGFSSQNPFRRPTVTEVIKLAEPFPSSPSLLKAENKDEITVKWESDATEFKVYDISQKEWKIIKETTIPQTTLSFGPDGDFAAPVGDEEIKLAVQASRSEGRATVYGRIFDLTAITRDELYGTEFNLESEITARNTVKLSWSETKGNTYEVCLLSGETYYPLFSTEVGTHEYESEPLSSRTSYVFRLRALDSSGKAVCEKEIEVETGISPIHASIWPNKRLSVYSDEDRETEIGTVEPSTYYCVLDEDIENNLFKIRYEDGIYGWIDSRYCMINLPEYIGDLVAYDITNAYQSMYTIHEYEIYGLTGKVVNGYETVRQDDGGYLAPLLYPTAKKLLNAAQEAANQGYRLRLYDTYRPKSSTNYIYDKAYAVIYNPIPFKTYTGNMVSLPAMPESAGERTQMVLLDLVQNNGWELSAFLARGGSYHNKGIAIDLSMESVVTGEVITAQTMMHDLSIYSTTYSNNTSANALYSIMEGSGLKTIVSEWWHFQDNDVQNELNPEYCDGGVSVRGWYYDGIGWRYRDASGRFIESSNVTENDSVFFFDTKGYLEE